MSQPNVIYILADDMGYGDMGCNNPNSRLVGEGMRFTNAHAPSSVCTPSRYAVMTGRYCWRSRLKNGIVWQWDAALIEASARRWPISYAVPGIARPVSASGISAGTGPSPTGRRHRTM